MNLLEFRKAFGKDIYEIEFSFKKKSYHLGVYYIKKLLRYGKAEFWFYEHNSAELQKFNTFDELLEVVVDGCRLKDILEDIEVVETY